MSRARDLADLSNVINKGANLQPNLIINSDMAVAQRGTSVSVSDGSNEGYQTLDRFAFYFNNSAGGACTISQSTTVPSGQGFSNSYKVDVTTADTSIAATHSIIIQHSVEAQNIRNSGWDYTSTSSYITLSFWARSTKAGIYNVAFRADDVGHKYYIAEYTLVADTWKKVTVTVPGDSSLVINNDTGSGLDIRWNLQAGSDRNQGTANQWNATDAVNQGTSNQVNFFDSTSNDFYLTGVSLVVGDSAPVTHPYESYSENLERCQRYLYRLDGNLYDHIAAGFRNNTDQFWFPLHLPCAMRAEPTYTASNVGIWYGTGGSWSTSVSGVALYAPSGGVTPYTIAPTTFTGISTSITEGIAAFAANGFLQLDAEL